MNAENGSGCCCRGMWAMGATGKLCSLMTDGLLLSGG